jgi:NADH-quinone oxidoreductase subunit C
VSVTPSSVTPSTDAVAEALAAPEPELVHGCPVTYSRDQRVVHVSRDSYAATLRLLVADGYVMCADLCAVDYLTYESPRELPDGVAAERFEIVLNLLSTASRQRLRVRVQIPEGDPVLASAFDVWPGTEAMEREAFDMFGISFDGHPDLTRILMPEDWDGHPLRKDYDVGRIPVQFKETR